MAIHRDESYTTSEKYCACIEFHPDDIHCHGFPRSQLVHYALEPNAQVGDDKNIPAQKLTVEFSNADVVILGWRLDVLADKLREGSLATVHVLLKQHAELEHPKCPLASINIVPIEKVVKDFPDS